MTWRDDLSRVTLPDGRNLIGASFRGVAFLVESADRGGGRRTVVHEFPLRDEPTIDDLGRRARVMSMDAYVLGDDYVAQRNALLAALEDVAGPGELVHPYYGTRRAICSSLSTRESIADGGMARFSLEFTEVPSQIVAPVATPDLAADVGTSATAAQEATSDELVEVYDTSGQPGYAVASLAAELSAVATALDEALAGVVEDTQEAARLDVEIQALVSDATTLIRTPADTVAALLAVLQNLAETIADAPRKVLAALLDAYDLEAQPLAQGESATRELERTNQAALADALRRVIIIEAARLLPSIEHETLEDAIADRTAVADRLEAQAATAGDTAYPVLVSLRTAVLRAIPGDATLARLETITRPVAVPSLLLAYQLYGDTTAEADIVARNAAEHPGFLAGDLQVLTDV